MNEGRVVINENSSIRVVIKFSPSRLLFTCKMPEEDAPRDPGEVFALLLAQADAKTEEDCSFDSKARNEDVDVDSEEKSSNDDPDSDEVNVDFFVPFEEKDLEEGTAERDAVDLEEGALEGSRTF